MDFNLMICEECDIPPNFVTTQKPGSCGQMIQCVTCRDCGEYWEDSSDDENFFPDGEGFEGEL